MVCVYSSTSSTNAIQFLIEVCLSKVACATMKLLPVVHAGASRTDGFSWPKSVQFGGKRARLEGLALHMWRVNL